MIKYNSGSFGFALLFRVHGSAVFKTLTPTLISSAIYLILYYYTDLADPVPADERLIVHPYAVGAMVAALTFLLAFRANFSYNRYWEGVTTVHQMHSKWLDCGMDLASFHLQSSKFDGKKPPAFGEHPELTCLERERERTNKRTMSELEGHLDQVLEEHGDGGVDGPQPRLRHRAKSTVGKKETPATSTATSTRSTKSINAPEGSQQKEFDVFHHGFLKRMESVDVNKPVKIRTDTTKDLTRSWVKHQPPLFLQEAAHLLSLLSAVAFSTLRNDLDSAESPLISFTPGAPWPHVDPDAYGADVRQDWALSSSVTFDMLRYIFGISRSPTQRTLYNAARPFRVIGGVSDAEIEILQAARGPLAKVALCTMWLQEFISREHLNGSLGKIGAPIVSRCFQFISDGMIGYNQARKVAYIPFPFPHAQITSLFVTVVIGVSPVLMLNYTTNEPFAFAMNFLTVMVFTGLHEVARELENPFQNVPNDIPFNNFQAQFNEGLMTMFAGYHPDAFWEVHQENEDVSAYPPTDARIESMEAGRPQQSAT